MSTALYHGPPGSYKTSLALKENLVNWVLEGRPVVTNVEGIDVQKIWEIYGIDKERPDSQFFLTLPTLSPVTFFVLRYFFCWAPVGCAFLIDEAQRVFPKNISDISYKLANISIDKFISSIREYYSISPSLFIEGKIFQQWDVDSIDRVSKELILDFVENRPKNISEAFETHRHYNWDFVFTSPNISLINPELRAILELSYKLINQNTRFSKFFIWMVGGKNTYKKYSHEPTNAGLNNAQHLAKFNGKIDDRVFDCYASTSTGLHNESIAETSEKNSFGLPFLALSLIAAFFAYNFLMPRDFLHGTSKEHSENVSENVSKNISENSTNVNFANKVFNKVIPETPLHSRSTFADSESNSDDVNSMNIISIGPLKGWYVVVSGCARIAKYYSCVINLQNPSDILQLRSISYESFLAIGYRIFSWGRDLHEIRFSGKRIALATPYFLPLVEKDTNEDENRFKEKFIN